MAEALPWRSARPAEAQSGALIVAETGQHSFWILRAPGGYRLIELRSERQIGTTFGDLIHAAAAGDIWHETRGAQPLPDCEPAVGGGHDDLMMC